MTFLPHSSLGLRHDSRDLSLRPVRDLSPRHAYTVPPRASLRYGSQSRGPDARPSRRGGEPVVGPVPEESNDQRNSPLDGLTTRILRVRLEARDELRDLRRALALRWAGQVGRDFGRGRVLRNVVDRRCHRLFARRRSCASPACRQRRQPGAATCSESHPCRSADCEHRSAH
jgi:hypothetical protein